MLVHDLLRKKREAAVITIPAHSDVGTAARLLMHHAIGGIPILLPDGSVAGFVSERDIVKALNRSTNGIRHWKVEEIMQRPAPTCSVDDRLNDVMTRMNRERLRHVLVMNGDGIAGVLSVGDFVKHRIEELETEAGVLRDYVVAQRARD